MLFLNYPSQTLRFLKNLGTYLGTQKEGEQWHSGKG